MFNGRLTCWTSRLLCPQCIFQGNHGHPCQWYGYESHQTGSRCLASGKTCKKCNKLGYVAAMCCSKPYNRSDELAVACRTVTMDSCFLGAVENEVSEAWYEYLSVGGTAVKFKINTCADISIVSSITWGGGQQPPPPTILYPTNVCLNSPGVLRSPDEMGE